MKHISIKDVALKAGVSTSAVSRVLNGKKGMVSPEMKEKVIRVCEELNYRLNPSIQDIVRKGRNGHTHNIAFVMVGADFSDPAYSRTIDGIAKGISDFDYNLILVHLSGNEETLYDFPPALKENRIDGIIITGNLTVEVIDMIKKLGKPHVILGNYAESVSAGSVCIRVNLKSAIAQMVAELRKAGKRHIAYFSESVEGHYESENLEAFRKALSENGLDDDGKLIYKGMGKFSGAYKTLFPVFSGKTMPFDAIVCLDFRCAGEISHLILARSWREKSENILLATTMIHEHQTPLPVPAIYCEGIIGEVAYKGMKCVIEMIQNGDSTPLSIDMNPEVTGIKEVGK